jgi:hypothetical protein
VTSSTKVGSLRARRSGARARASGAARRRDEHHARRARGAHDVLEALELVRIRAPAVALERRARGCSTPCCSRRP